MISQQVDKSAILILMRYQDLYPGSDQFLIFLRHIRRNTVVLITEVKLLFKRCQLNIIIIVTMVTAIIVSCFIMKDWKLESERLQRDMTRLTFLSFTKNIQKDKIYHVYLQRFLKFNA